MNIAIVTATYNRKLLISNLQYSLENQTDKNFVWVIVDDGSTDGTEHLISSLETDLKIRYRRQINGGKARALNNSFRIDTDIDLFVIVDSDDILLPNAIEVIRGIAISYENDPNVGALQFRYQDTEGNILHSKGNFRSENRVLTRYQHDVIYSKDDGCICYFKKVVQKYLYPEYPNEKYIGPTVIQMEMSAEFKIVFRNEVVGIAEYQEDGISKSGRKLRILSPIGMAKYCLLMRSNPNSRNIVVKHKYTIMYWAYIYIYRCTQNNTNGDKLLPIEKIKSSIMIRTFGRLLGFYWIYRYK